MLGLPCRGPQRATSRVTTPGARKICSAHGSTTMWMQCCVPAGDTARSAWWTWWIGSSLLTARPKPFVGSSDATVLHEGFAAQLDVVTWFGPMPATDTFAIDDDVDALIAELSRPITQPQLLRVLRSWYPDMR